MARKRRNLAAGTGDDDVNLTPMLDVVFILLIFFIVTAQFIKEPGVDIERQNVENDERVSPLAILIAIDENSEIYIDKKVVDLQSLEFTLKQMREDNPKGNVVVQADNDSNAEILVGIMEAIAAVDGATQVNVSTEKDA